MLDIGLSFVKQSSFAAWHGATWFAFSVTSSLARVVALAMLVASVLGASPFGSGRNVRNPGSWERYRPALVLVLGTFAAYLASDAWDTMGRDGCKAVVSQEYFAQLSQVIPLLLVGLGLEAKFVQRLTTLPERAVVVITVAMLCLAEVLAVTALVVPEDHVGCVSFLPGWHEYLAFIVTMEATTIALAVLAVALLRIETNSGEPPHPTNDPAGSVNQPDDGRAGQAGGGQDGDALTEPVEPTDARAVRTSADKVAKVFGYGLAVAVGVAVGRGLAVRKEHVGTTRRRA